MDNKELIVEVNEKLDACDGQMCIAHELAHIVLESERMGIATTSGVNVSRSMPDHVIEMLCDLSADEIVLPRDWLHKQLLDGNGSLASVVEIASRAKLPADFVVARIIELELRQWRAIWWVENCGKFTIVKSLPHWDDGFIVCVDLVEGFSNPVSECWETGSMSIGEVRLRIEGEEHDYAGECVKTTNNEVLCIIYPRIYARADELRTGAMSV